MTRWLAVIFLTFITPVLNAATLEGIVTPYSLLAEDAAADAMWPTEAELPGIKWHDKALRKDVVGRSVRYVRLGKIRLYRHGTASIFLSGSQESVSEIDLSVWEQEGRIFEQNQFTKVLRAQFTKQTTIELLQKCPSSIVSGHATYKVTLVGRKPIYVAVMTDAGGSAPKSRSSSFHFSHNHESRWRCDP